MDYALVLSTLVNFRVATRKPSRNAVPGKLAATPSVRAKDGAILGVPAKLQSNFGPVQGRDKWRASSQATPEAALRILYSAPSKQTVAPAPVAPHKRKI